ncbi:MAG: hypothetical protein U5K79_12335 [Cyclobacteriaceae bacterium]|nr:hypothetical protein [Cyclobacteriaceae bacterium]
MNKRKPTRTSINDRIATLERQSELLREAIDQDLNETRERAIDIGKMALIVGGGVVLSMIVFKSFFGHKDDEEQSHSRPRVYHRFRDQIGSELSNRAALYFLGLAQEKLMSYLQPNRENEENPDATPGK